MDMYQFPFPAIPVFEPDLGNEKKYDARDYSKYPNKSENNSTSSPLENHDGEEETNREKIEKICQPLVLNNDKLLKVEEILRNNIKKSLKARREPESSVPCLPTYVTELPTGSEKGIYVVVDFGGPHCRLIVTDIDGEVNEKYYNKTTTKELKEGKKEQLFEHIANSMQEFLEENEVDMNEELKCGFIFGFPVIQSDINSGTLQKWTKGFRVPEVEGEDVRKLLTRAFGNIRGMNINIVSLLNNTTALLYGAARKNPKCRMSLILGFGINASYVEKIDEIGLINDHRIAKSTKEMIINTEMGSFGDDGELDNFRTDWDKALDKETHDESSQVFEKMISKMYMGELVRRVLLELNHRGLIFEDNSLEMLQEQGTFNTDFVSQIESDPVGAFGKARVVLEKLGISKASDEDCDGLRYVCECVSIRAAHLMATSCVALLKRMDHKDVMIAVDGDLFHSHPYFGLNMQSKIKQLMGRDFKIDMLPHCAGIGAAYLAANQS